MNCTIAQVGTIQRKNTMPKYKPYKIRARALSPQRPRGRSSAKCSAFPGARFAPRRVREMRKAFLRDRVAWFLRGAIFRWKFSGCCPAGVIPRDPVEAPIRERQG